MPGNARPVQPCLDLRCPVHARGADPGTSARTCARQILRAYDRAGAIALLEQEVPVSDPGGDRVLFSLRSSPLGVGQSARLVPVAPVEPPRRPIHQFRAEQVLLGDASWRVDDLLLGGRSQIAPHAPLPAELFSTRVAGAGLRAFDRIAHPIQIELAVTRVEGTGSDVLIGAVLGSATYAPRVLQMHSGARVGQDVSPGRPALAIIRGECEQPIEVHRLVIDDGADWVIHDVQVDGRSAFSQGGDVPGDVFSADASDTFVHFGVIRRATQVQIYASYVGGDPEGRPFVGEFRGQEPEPE